MLLKKEEKALLQQKIEERKFGETQSFIWKGRGEIRKKLGETHNFKIKKKGTCRAAKEENFGRKLWD